MSLYKPTEEEIRRWSHGLPTPKLLSCPFCGGEATIFGENSVGCMDFQCGAEINFGHWCGIDENGIPAVAHVIDRWNTRV